jgi:hypothetical protein
VFIFGNVPTTKNILVKYIMPTNKKTFDESMLYPSTKKKEKKENKRVFRAIFENPDGIIVLDGKYHGTKPRQAASKAFSKILRIYADANMELTTQIYFGLKECTRKTKVKKCYWYTGLKKQLEVPAKSRIKKDPTTGTPYINPDTGKPVVDPVTGKEVIDPKTCKPLLDSSGNPVIIYHNFTNIVKKSKIIFCKHLLDYDKNKDNDSDTGSILSNDDEEEQSTIKIKQKDIEKKPTKKKSLKK